MAGAAGCKRKTITPHSDVGNDFYFLLSTGNFVEDKCGTTAFASKTQIKNRRPQETAKGMDVLYTQTALVKIGDALS